MTDKELLIDMLAELTLADLLEEWQIMEQYPEEYDQQFKEVLAAVIAIRVKRRIRKMK